MMNRFEVPTVGAWLEARREALRAAWERALEAGGVFLEPGEREAMFQALWAAVTGVPEKIFLLDPLFAKTGGGSVSPKAMAAFGAVLVPALLTWGAAMSRWIDALHKLVEVGMDLTANLSLEVVLQKVVDRAGQIAQARYAALGVRDETTGKLGRFLVAGVDPETYAKIGRPPEAMAGVLGELLGVGKTLRLKDLTQHPKFSGFPPHHPAGRSFLGVPIRYQDQILGDPI